jgi:hypothetical protein
MFINFYYPLRTSDFLESKKDAVAHPAPHHAYAMAPARVKDELNISRRIHKDPTRLNLLARRIPSGRPMQIPPRDGYILNPVWLIG